MKINLVPNKFKNIIRTLCFVTVMMEVVVVFVSLLSWICGIALDFYSAIKFCACMHFATVPMLCRGFRFVKVSYSTVVFDADRIRVLTKGGRCWREIFYESITKFQEEEIVGFFYGREEERERLKATYVCFYLNGETNKPDVSYKRLFKHENFIMINNEDQDALTLFESAYSMYMNSTAEGYRT